MYGDQSKGSKQNIKDEPISVYAVSKLTMNTYLMYIGEPKLKSVGLRFGAMVA